MLELGIMKFDKLVDCHVHSNFSDDSTMRLEEGVAAAVQLGLKGLTFTDHLDLDFPDNQYLFDFDINERSDRIGELAQRYAGTIEVLHGIELGAQPHTITETISKIKGHNFDFIICSIHAVDGFALHQPDGFYEDKTKDQAYRRYLEEVYWSVCNVADFDVVGHLGYIRRYGPYESKSMPYKHFDEYIDAILKAVIDSGRGIEINVSGYAYKLGSPIPDVDIVRRYKELGGQIVTLGSDAHSADQIGKSFKQGLALIEKVGFDYVAYFKNRKPVFVPLP